jgi:ABC-type dipeptide/oligopeptide/nickel transport system permease subunit
VSEERHVFVWVGGAIVAVLVLIAVLAPLIAPYDPQAVAGPSLSAPSAAHLLGTNDTGQDILSQLIWGTRSSAVVAVLAAALAVALGVAVGATAGLLGGWTDLVAMRSVDLFLAVPMLPLLILIAALAGPSRRTVILVIGLTGWPSVARVVRSQTLNLAGRGYIEACRGFGSGRLYVIRRHLIPVLSPLASANFVYWAATAVVLQAGLAFLGLSDPTEVSWGSVLNRALAHQGIYYGSAWLWWVLPAGLAITLAVLGLAFVGVGLEPRANPRWRRA